MCEAHLGREARVTIGEHRVPGRQKPALGCFDSILSLALTTRNPWMGLRGGRCSKLSKTLQGGRSLQAMLDRRLKVSRSLPGRGETEGSLVLYLQGQSQKRVGAQHDA